MEQPAHRLAEPVLVTGALGFIGYRLINRLLQENYQVIAFILPHHSLPPEWNNKVEAFHGDITQEKDVEAAVAKAKTLFHFAAIVSDWGDEKWHHAVTVQGTKYVMDAALKHNVKVIQASSITVYGDKINQGLCQESDNYGNPLGAYSASKQAQEQCVREYIDKGVDVRIIRPANIYGSGSRPWVDDLSAELKKRTPVLMSGGNMDAGLVHVENVVELMMLAATSPAAKGQIYNICDEEGVTWKRYISELAHIIHAPAPRSLPKSVAKIAATVMETLWRVFNMKNRPPLTHEALNLVGSHHQISMKKAKEELGYSPVVDFEQGMKDVAQYVKEKQP